jgi:hypothetical protein
MGLVKVKYLCFINIIKVMYKIDCKIITDNIEV